VGQLRRVMPAIDLLAILGWYHRQEHERFAVASQMQCDFLSVYLLGTIVGIIVEVDAAAAHRRALEVTEFGGAAGVFVVLSPDRQPEAVTSRYHDTGRPYLDIDPVRLARCERLHFIVGVIGTIRGAQIGVESAM